MRFSHIAMPITVLPKDDQTDFTEEERLGLPHWTMIWAHLRFGRRIRMSGHSDLGIFNNCGAYFLPWYKQILHQLLVLRILAVWI